MIVILWYKHLEAKAYYINLGPYAIIRSEEHTSELQSP